MNRRTVCLGIGWLLVLGLGCGVATPRPQTETPGLVRTPTASPSPAAERTLPDLNLRSPAFAEGERIPRDYTCDGADRSPPLRWDPPPSGTRSLVLVVDDPDAPGGRFVHWVLYEIPPQRMELPEGLPAEPSLPGVGMQAYNDFGRVGYGGPCPPPGSTHRYRFTLYALSTVLNLPPGARYRDVEAMLPGHLLAVGHLTAQYGR